MNKNRIVVVALVAALLIPMVTRAHENDKTVMGTISSIDGTNLMVKAADGKTTMVMLNAKTKITQGKTKIHIKALKAGDRVVASGPEEKSMITAETVKVGVAPAPKK